MSTMPPEQPGSSTPPPPAGYSGMGRSPMSGAILPVPGNAELAVWFIVVVVLAIVAAVADSYNTNDWVVSTTWLTVAYILSRGIAKASRVLEQ